MSTFENSVEWEKTKSDGEENKYWPVGEGKSGSEYLDLDKSHGMPRDGTRGTSPLL
jgi:hypothetical protein